MNPEPVDLKTGALDPAGTVIRPENILQALLERAGYGEETDLRAEPYNAIFG